jgi:hypothetical protein
MGSIAGQNRHGPTRLEPCHGASEALSASALGIVPSRPEPDQTPKPRQCPAQSTRANDFIMVRRHRRVDCSNLLPCARILIAGKFARRYSQGQAAGHLPLGRRCTGAWVADGPLPQTAPSQWAVFVAQATTADGTPDQRWGKDRLPLRDAMTLGQAYAVARKAAFEGCARPRLRGNESGDRHRSRLWSLYESSR